MRWCLKKYLVLYARVKVINRDDCDCKSKQQEDFEKGNGSPHSASDYKPVEAEQVSKK